MRKPEEVLGAYTDNDVKILKEWATEIIDEVRQKISEKISDREWEDMDEAIDYVKENI